MEMWRLLKILKEEYYWIKKVKPCGIRDINFIIRGITREIRELKFGIKEESDKK